MQPAIKRQRTSEDGSTSVITSFGSCSGATVVSAQPSSTTTTTSSSLLLSSEASASAAASSSSFTSTSTSSSSSSSLSSSALDSQREVKEKGSGNVAVDTPPIPVDPLVKKAKLKRSIIKDSRAASEKLRTKWIAAKAVFGSLIKTKERPGMLGVCACPGLRNTRPSRSDGCPQRSLTDDIRTLVEERVKDLIIVATDYEIKHYCGVSNSDYLRLLIEHGIRPWQFSVQDLRPPDLATELAIHAKVIQCLSEGRNVMMHSRKSWGRVPTIVATMMLSAHPDLTPDRAIDLVRRAVSRHSVQTVKQYNHIHEFDAYRKKDKEQLELEDKSQASSNPTPISSAEGSTGIRKSPP